MVDDYDKWFDTQDFILDLFERNTVRKFKKDQRVRLKSERNIQGKIIGLETQRRYLVKFDNQATATSRYESELELVLVRPVNEGWVGKRVWVTGANDWSKKYYTVVAYYPEVDRVLAYELEDENAKLLPQSKIHLDDRYT